VVELYSPFGAKHISPVGPKGQETPADTAFETENQLSLSITILIQKQEITTVHAQIYILLKCA
jgi:hypothetical protein